LVDRARPVAVAVAPTSWLGGGPVPIFTLASKPPAPGSFREAIFAGVRVG